MKYVFDNKDDYSVGKAIDIALQEQAKEIFQKLINNGSVEKTAKEYGLKITTNQR